MLKFVVFATILGLFFFPYTVFSEIIINEVLANPSCSESYCEYVEIYNNETSSVNLTGWSILDDNSEDSLSGNSENFILGGNSFGLIVDEDSRVYSNFDVENVLWIYVDDTAIGGSGLSNSGETITLKDSLGNNKSSMSYSGSNDGLSWSLINGSWIESTPSPGKNNTNNLSLNNDYSRIYISEFLPDPEGEDNAVMPNGEWIELYNSGDMDLDLLGFGFKDNSGNDFDLYITNTTTTSGTVIKSKDYLIVHVNGVSGFLNNNAYEKIKLYDLNEVLIDSVSYEGSDEGVSWSLKDGKWELAKPTLAYGNLDNSSSIVSNVRIDEIYDLGDGKAEWGDVIRVKLYVYRGNTGKKTVWLWIEDSLNERVTKKSKFTVEDKFQNYTFTYPVFIPENCNDEYASGRGKVVIEGLDVNDEFGIDIREKPLCKNGVKKTRVKDFEYELVEFPKNVIDNEPFDINLKLKSNKEDLRINVQSYVMSGRKNYSEDNTKTIMLEEGKEETFSLRTTLSGTNKLNSPRLKVKIFKEGRKTPYDITREIEILNSDNSRSENIKKGLSSITGGVIYEGKSIEAGRKGIFFFSGLMMSLGIYSFFRRWKIQILK